ncbi:MAG: hypothetical protein ACJ71K_03970 [Nitrososphaeraceae archaeon]
MKEKPKIGLIIVVAGFIGTVFDISPAFGFAAESFLTIERANISIDEADDELSAELIVEGPSIPLNGTESTFGYGLRTGGGEDTILVVHTHAGLLDSEDQRFIGDAGWHTHLIRLGDVEQCEQDKGIVDVTWQSPGEVSIDDDTATISGIPTDEFEGWDSITGDSLSMALGEGVNEAISFKLEPVYGGEDDDELEAICVTDIRSAEEVSLD